MTEPDQPPLNDILSPEEAHRLLRLVARWTYHLGPRLWPGDAAGTWNHRSKLLRRMLDELEEADRELVPSARPQRGIGQTG